MVETRIDQLDGDDEALQDFPDAAMRVDVGAKFVATKKRIAGEERVPFAFEVLILRQPDNFVAVFLHPIGKERRFPRHVLRGENCSG